MVFVIFTSVVVEGLWQTSSTCTPGAISGKSVVDAGCPIRLNPRTGESQPTLPSSLTWRMNSVASAHDPVALSLRIEVRRIDCAQATLLLTGEGSSAPGRCHLPATVVSGCMDA